MNVWTRVSDIDTERALFGLGGILTAISTVVVLERTGDVVQAALFSAFTLYLLGAALPQMYTRVPHYERTGAIILGIIGLFAYTSGVQSALAVLFMLGGVAGLLRLF